MNAPDYFLATISQPLAERGYYVFPVNMVKSVLSDDGLSDADMVHAGDPHRLGEIFGADAVMYISIDRCEAKYIVLTAKVTVELRYTLKSAQSGQEFWSSHQTVVYQPQGSNAGLAAITKAAPNYMPLARQANWGAVYSKGSGLPSGPHDARYRKDGADFKGQDGLLN